jgi:uncharacterized protein YggL (DUF469 family)
MTERAELVSHMRASLGLGLDLKHAERILHALQDDFLVPNGLYLDGGLAHFGVASMLSAEIAGLVTRADGKDLSERDRNRVQGWLAKNAQVTEFSMSPLKPADSPEFRQAGSEGEE